MPCRPCRLQRAAIALLVALAVLVPTARLEAQAADGCSVDLFKPAQLAQAMVFVQRAAEATEPVAATRALRDAMRLLQDDRRFTANPLGLAYARAQIYMLWMHQKDAPAAMTPAELNSGRDRTTQIPLAATTDSLFSVVERAAPECEADIDRWRQSKPWSELIGTAYRFLGENAIDSADVYARRAMQLDRRSPFLYNALAQIALRRGDREEGLKQLEASLALADRDTALVETARQLRTQYAATMQEHALTKTDAGERNELLLAAARTFLQIGQEEPEAVDGPAYISAALDIAMLLQDQELVREILDPMIQEPLPYPDLSLLLGAETSRLLNRTDDAIALYVASLEKNPNIRDANYFLAYLYLEAKQPEKATPLLDKLIELDPSNPDNLLMRTMAARQVAEAERDPPKRAALIREVEALSARESAMQHRLQVTRFERRAEGAVLHGDIENRARRAKPFTVEVSFLDLDGNVVETLSTTTEPVAPNASATFTITATKPGIVAYRYTPLV